MQTLSTRLILAFALVFFCGEPVHSQTPTPTSTPIAGATQLRLEIEFEGPWMFYLDTFTSAGSNVPMLVAMSPRLLDHNDPTFSMGDGLTVDLVGTYCVGFDDPGKGNQNIACRPYGNQFTPGSNPPYADPGLLVMKKGNFQWKSLTDSYVLVVPLPDSYSADGQEVAGFLTKDGTLQFSQSTAIGIQLHYTLGPANVGLLTCSDRTALENCKDTFKDSVQANSGTLRISVTSPVENLDFLHCHVRHAYRTMVGLIDPNNSVNPDRADIQSDCPIPFNILMKKHPEPRKSVDQELKQLIKQMQKEHPACGESGSPLCKLYALADTLNSRLFLRRSQLTEVAVLLQRLLVHAAGRWTLLTIKNIRFLEKRLFSGVNGVDCRALQMQVTE